jgi:hypothetical protein
MTDEIKIELEDYISNWHWDAVTYTYAFELGKFLFGFIKYLDTLNSSNRTIKKHTDNTYLIGHFHVNYSSQSDVLFDFKNLIGSDFHRYEYERKVSDSPSSIAGYRSTCKLLDKYIESKTYLDFIIE